MKKSQAFPSTYLSKEDVSTPVVATIRSVQMGRIKSDHGEEDKPVMSFMSPPGLKPLIVNNTNWSIVESLYGDESDFWSGKPIELYWEPNVNFGGKLVGGVRVRAPRVGGAPGVPGVEFWDLNRALTELGRFGVTREQFIERWREQGFQAYNPARDTAAVRAWIAQLSQPQEESFGGEEQFPDEEEELPPVSEKFQNGDQYPENPDADPLPSQEPPENGTSRRRGRKKAGA